MKIVLDLSDLVERGHLTPAEAERLRGLAALDASAVTVNLLVGFGLAAVLAGVGALVPTAATAVALGGLLVLIGISVRMSAPRTLGLFGLLCVVVGTLAACGGIVALDAGSLRAVLWSALAMAVAGALVRSGFLIACAVLAVGATLGTSTDYRHALYSLSVQQPALTIVVFAGIALAGYLASLRLPAAYERLAVIASRVAVLAVNFGFWVGSLWGDDFAGIRHRFANPAADGMNKALFIPASAFALGWALALVAVAVWALRRGRMWAVNTVAVFGAIHFYTQWFERLGAEPLAVLGAGLLTLMLALALWHLNRRDAEPRGC